MDWNPGLQGGSFCLFILFKLPWRISMELFLIKLSGCLALEWLFVVAKTPVSHWEVCFLSCCFMKVFSFKFINESGLTSFWSEFSDSIFLTSLVGIFLCLFAVFKWHFSPSKRRLFHKLQPRMKWKPIRPPINRASALAYLIPWRIFNQGTSSRSENTPKRFHIEFIKIDEKFPRQQELKNFFFPPAASKQLEASTPCCSIMRTRSVVGQWLELLIVIRNRWAEALKADEALNFRFN